MFRCSHVLSLIGEPHYFGNCWIEGGTECQLGNVCLSRGRVHRDFCNAEVLLDELPTEQSLLL